MSEQFYSEDGVDKWVSENMLLPKRGFFVDVGCAHPFRYSQTAWLRERGWTGLAIDGDSAYAPEWDSIPNVAFLNTVVSNTPITRFLVEPTNALVSRVHDLGIEVPSKSLHQIFQELQVPNEIDFMSVDIEGMEASVLADAFSNFVYPHILVAEYNSCHKGRDPEVFNVCFGAGYSLVNLTDSNAVFVR